MELPNIAVLQICPLGSKQKVTRKCTLFSRLAGQKNYVHELGCPMYGKKKLSCRSSFFQCLETKLSCKLGPEIGCLKSTLKVSMQIGCRLVPPKSTPKVLKQYSAAPNVICKIGTQFRTRKKLSNAFGAETNSKKVLVHIVLFSATKKCYLTYALQTRSPRNS